MPVHPAQAPSASARWISARSMPHPASILCVFSVNLVFAYWLRPIAMPAAAKKMNASSPVQKTNGLPITISYPSTYLTTVTVPAIVPCIPQEYSYLPGSSVKVCQ